MVNIAVGTTPTIKYTFSRVNPADIASAILTVRQSVITVLTKDLASATVDENSISWTLSQEETLRIGEGTAEFMLNWVDTHGVRGVGAVKQVLFVPNHITEVMT